MIGVLTGLFLSCTGPALEDSGIEAGIPATADAGPDHAVVLGESVTLDGSASQGVAYSWDFGDGASADGTVATHTYAEVGSYAAVLTVTGEDGGWRSDTAVVTVTAPLAAITPTWSRTIARVGDTLWVVTPEADQVSVLSASDGALIMEIAVCDSPRTLSHDPTTAEVAVACEDGDALWGLSTDGAVRWTVAFDDGSRPFGVAGRDGIWHVTLQGTGQLASVSDGALRSTLDVGPDVRGVALAGAGEVLVTGFRAAEGVARWYRILDGTVEAHALALDELGDSDTTTGGVPNLLEEIAPSPDGSTWYLPMLHANILRGPWLSGENLDFQTTVRGVLGRIDASTRTEAVADRKQFDERGRASAVAFSPSGDRIYVLHPGAGAVTVLSTSTDQIIGSILDIGTFPTGLVTAENGETLYVHAWLDRAVLAYDVTDLSVPPAAIWVGTTLTEEPLSASALLGKQVFHDARDTRLTRSSYVSCAHCHPDGRDDGLTWDFTDRGEGLRNTTSLEGRAGMGMGPLHWTGNFDEVQDFEHDIRGPFAGTGFMSESDWSETADPLGTPKTGRSVELDALATWLTTLATTPRSPHPTDTAGEAAFYTAGCDGCHPPPLYTDSPNGVRHPMPTVTEASGQRLGATLDGLDTPTLLGCWSTHPYLHDGSAPTIRDAILSHTDISEEEATMIAQFVRAL